MGVIPSADNVAAWYKNNIILKLIKGKKNESCDLSRWTGD